LPETRDLRENTFNGAGRVAEGAEEIIFSLATRRMAREKLQPLRGQSFI